MPYTIGISAEFMASYDEELSYEYEFPVIEHLLSWDLASLEM